MNMLTFTKTLQEDVFGVFFPFPKSSSMQKSSKKTSDTPYNVNVDFYISFIIIIMLKHTYIKMESIF